MQYLQAAQQQAFLQDYAPIIQPVDKTFPALQTGIFLQSLSCS
jgi:hypothetical protein